MMSTAGKDFHFEGNRVVFHDGPVHTERFVYDDGGRAAAGFRGMAGDCVTRAIAIAAEQPYREVYDALHAEAKWADSFRTKGQVSPRNGVKRRVYDAYLKRVGWTWTPTMAIGSGCTVHLRADELPVGRLVVRLSRHLVAVIDGVIHDTDDRVSRAGERCVYGYYRRAASGASDG